MSYVKFTLLLLLICFQANTLHAQKLAYQIFDKKGKMLSYDSLLNASAEANIILFGEIHNNPIGHWLQNELTKDLYKKVKENLILGAEMLESDNQIILDEYLEGFIDEKKFEAEARLWPNYKTDYKPIVDFAKKKKLSVIATNVPRRYASMVYKKGLSELNTLSDAAKKWIAPLPIEVDLELNSYKEMLNMAHSTTSKKDSTAQNFPHSQAVKDATMAHFILSNWIDGDCFLHFNGSYHSDDYEGINWYLKQKKKEAKILTITTVEQPDVRLLAKKFKGKADFIICVPKSMTKTH